MIIPEIQYFKQKDKDHCGPTVVSMTLTKYGLDISQEQIADAIMKIRTDGLKNTFTFDVCGYLRQFGIWAVYYAGFDDQLSWDLLIKNIDNQIPVIITHRYSMKSSRGHFRVVLGHYILKKKGTVLVVYHDPIDGAHESMKKETFQELWKPDGISSDILIKNEMVILFNSKPNVNTKNCISCKNNLTEKNIDFYNRSPEYHFINSSTKIDSIGTRYFCNNCNGAIAIFD